MKIWLLQTGEPLPMDENVRRHRTGMLSEVLLARGHQVTWWTSAFEHQRKVMLFDCDGEHVLPDGLRLKVIKGPGYRKNVSLARYRDHLEIASKFKLQAEQMNELPDVIVTSLPCHNLSYEAVRFAKAKNIPVLVDIRDLWPDIFLDKIPYFLKSLGRKALKGDFRKVKELMQKADGILAVSNSYLQWGLEKAGRNRGQWDRVFFLGYSNGRSQDEASKKGAGWLEQLAGKKVILFVGTFGLSYELDLVLDAARRLESKDDILFVIAGTGEKEKEISEKARNIKNVILPGWIDRWQIRNLLNISYLGLVPCDSAFGTIPNKPFEYWSAGLPVVSSLEGDMPDLIDKYRIGLSYAPGSLEGLLRCLEKLVEDKNFRDELSANAFAFFTEFGNAERIYSEFADHVENLALSKSDINVQKIN